MYAGKSKQLILIYKKFEDMGASQIAFKPVFDTRTTTIESRSGISIPSVAVENPLEFEENIKGKDVIFIDEFQFFTPALIEDVLKFLKKGKTFVISGLDKDFMKDNFEVYNTLRKHATTEIKMSAVCHTCGRVAKFSRKENATIELINGSRIELDKGTEKTQYFSACDRCHPIK